MRNSFITASHVNLVSIDKITFMNYVCQDPVAKMHLLKVVPRFPSDADLRRFMVEKNNWQNFKQSYISARVPTPKQVAIDKQDMKNQSTAEQQQSFDIPTRREIVPHIDMIQQQADKIFADYKHKEEIQKTRPKQRKKLEMAQANKDPFAVLEGLITPTIVTSTDGTQPKSSVATS